MIQAGDSLSELGSSGQLECLDYRTVRDQPGYQLEPAGVS